jgi:hypothetical protein
VEDRCAVASADTMGERIVKEEAVMATAHCPRCNGFLVTEWSDGAGDGLGDVFVETGIVEYAVRRCVQCGERIDPVIIRNRELQLKAAAGTGAMSLSGEKARS